MLTLLLLACRPPEAAAVPVSPPTDLRAVAWMAGRWVGPEGASTETWVDRDHALFGVAFAPGPEGTWFEVLMVNDAEGVAFTAWPGGGPPTAFAATAASPAQVRFENPAHDFPQSIAYQRDGEALTATVGGSEGAPLVWEGRAEAPVRVEAVEEADRRFAADGSTRGVAAWTDVLDAKGSFWMGTAIAGPELTAVLGPALDRRKLEWAPVASGLAPAGDLAFTVGDYRWVAPDGAVGETGSYVSVWRKQPDGGWKVLFDAGAPR